MKKILFVLAALVLITSCATVDYPHLVGTEDNNTEVYMEGVYTRQRADVDDSLTVSVEGLDVGSKDVAAVYVGIRNKSEDVYNFVDSNIEIFGGNKDTGEWVRIGTWDAEAYYENVKEKENRARLLAFFSIFLGAYSDASDSPLGDSAAALSDGLGMAAIMEASDAEAASYFSSTRWLRANMLYSADIPADDIYSGVVLFNGRGLKKKAFPDYKVVFNSGNAQSHEFVLQRSDRESVLNPWIDKPYNRYTVTLAFDPLSDTFGTMTIYNAPVSIGFYMGIMIRSKNEICLTLPIGMTIKAFPNTWILTGGDFRFGNGEDILAPQLGVNVVTNWISAFAIAEYQVKSKKFGLTVGAGYEFTIN